MVVSEGVVVMVSEGGSGGEWWSVVEGVVIVSEGGSGGE